MCLALCKSYPAQSVKCWNCALTADSLGVEKLATICTVAPKAKPNEVRGRIPTLSMLLRQLVLLHTAVARTTLQVPDCKSNLAVFYNRRLLSCWIAFLTLFSRVTFAQSPRATRTRDPRELHAPSLHRKWMEYQETRSGLGTGRPT